MSALVEKLHCHYLAFGRVIAAPAGLPLVEAPSGSTASLRLVETPALAEQPEPSDGLVHSMEDYPGGPVMRLWRVGETFAIAYDGWRFVLDPVRAHIDYADIDHGHSFGLNLTIERVVLPLYVLFDQPGALGLHGSAVAIDGRAYVFIGRSGAGKSTTAYELMCRGARLLADDMTVVDVGQGTALGATPTIRLWKAAGEVPEALEERRIWEQASKRWFRVGAERGCGDALPLGAVILLDPDRPELPNSPMLETPGERDALVALLEQTFDFSHPWRDWMVRRFRNAARLVREFPVYRFVYAKSPSGEPTHVEPLLDALQTPSADASAPLETP